MTQAEINRAVALVTGETLCTVSGLGFSIADPDLVDYDPEPSDIEDMIVDWDELALHCNTPLLPA
jgi:hypothetical protein